MNGRLHIPKAAALLGALLLAGALAAPELRAATISIQPDKLTRMFNLQNDVQFPWRVQSRGGVASFTYQLRIPAGHRITGLRYVHECPTPDPGACGTVAGIWRVKASEAVPLQQVYGASYGEYSMGLWVEGSAVKDADIVVRPGWRYFVGVTCNDAMNMVGEIQVTWR